MLDDLNYALSKQVNTINAVHSDYGDLPLSDGDLDRVAEFVEHLLTEKAKALRVINGE